VGKERTSGVSQEAAGVVLSEPGRKERDLAGSKERESLSQITRRNEKSCWSSTVADKGGSVVSYDNKDLWHDRDSCLCGPVMG
jgi:hypothetical protein